MELKPENDVEADLVPPQDNNLSKKISAGVLQMNFMKRTYNKLEVENRQKKKKRKLGGRIVYPTVLTVDDEALPGLDGIVREDRPTKLEDLSFGRFSFGGQDPEVEKLMETYARKAKREDGEISEEEVEVSAKDMAQTLNSYRSSGVKRPHDREEEDILIETGRGNNKKRRTKLKVQGRKEF